MSSAHALSEIIDTFGSLIDIAGVLLILGGLIIAAVRYLLAFCRMPDSYKVFRQDIGRPILLGLESSSPPTSSGRSR